MSEFFQFPLRGILSVKQSVGIFTSKKREKTVVLAEYNDGDWFVIETKKYPPTSEIEYIILGFERPPVVSNYLIVRTTNQVGSVIEENIYQFRETAESGYSFVLI